ncbi:hypothetical protein ACFYSF_26170 [Streptomyces canus]
MLLRQANVPGSVAKPRAGEGDLYGVARLDPGAAVKRLGREAERGAVHG